MPKEHSHQSWFQWAKRFLCRHSDDNTRYKRLGQVSWEKKIDQLQVCCNLLEMGK